MTRALALLAFLAACASRTNSALNSPNSRRSAMGIVVLWPVMTRSTFGVLAALAIVCP